jgi:hypothetical protein
MASDDDKAGGGASPRGCLPVKEAFMGPPPAPAGNIPKGGSGGVTGEIDDILLLLLLLVLLVVVGRLLFVIGVGAAANANAGGGGGGMRIAAAALVGLWSNERCGGCCG